MSTATLYLSLARLHLGVAAERLRRLAEEADGVWRTIRGRRVFIRKGESAKDALARSLRGKGEDDQKFGKGPTTLREHRLLYNKSVREDPEWVRTKRRHKQQGIATISPDSAAVWNYTSDSGPINKMLRAGKFPRNTPAEDHGTTTRDLDSLFSRTSLAKDITVYRAVPKAVYQKLEKTVGSSYSDKAFLSTTTDPSRLLSLLPKTKRKDFRLIRIDLPAGSKALPVSHLANSSAKDNEVLVARKTRFSVSLSGNQLTFRTRR